jgi:hypothetical protein
MRGQFVPKGKIAPSQKTNPQSFARHDRRTGEEPLMPLSRLIYYSENQLDPQKGSLLTQLNDILKVSKRNNKALGVTGALLFDDLWFIQVLEGHRADVLKIYDRLKQDDRHAKITLVELCDIKGRMFGNWWMSLATRNDATLPAFAPHLRKDRLRPDRMTAAQLLTLIGEVAKLGIQREILNPVG